MAAVKTTHQFSFVSDITSSINDFVGAVGLLQLVTSCFTRHFVNIDHINLMSAVLHVAMLNIHYMAIL